MNATVTKSAKKAKAETPAVKSGSKTSHAAPVAAGSENASGECVARLEKQAVGRNQKSLGDVYSTAPDSRPSSASGTKTGGKPGTGAKCASTPPSAASPKAPRTRTSLSSNNASGGFEDKIHRTAVSKVIEVATKTPKTNTSVPADGAILTEAQLLKMSEKDYMNEAQLAFFKARLQQLEKDLLKNAGETTEHLRETVLVPDPADRATIEEEHALELRTRDRERKLLKKVQQSIASIDGGEYGWCEETGEPIGIPRLLARPTATLSLEAQQRRELKQKLYGD
ncbi:DnaK suppressor protein [Actimicrobium sp. GrIS 1.19]|nr:DnaK suppressor protein [Actimicrobium sp. GrIS 1.19]